MNPPRISELFQALLPPAAATAELAGTGDPALLLGGERLLVRQATPLRAAEFAAGRICARHAAARFGVVDCPIGVREDRRACWPELLTGSITHTDGFCAAAVGERRRFRAIGIDAERIGAVSPDLWSQWLLPEEADWLDRLPRSVQATVATLLFSAKEAFYKCQYEVTQQWLEFRDVCLDFDGRHLERNSFAVRPVGGVRLLEPGSGPVIVRYAITRELVLTAVTLSAH
jgi:4'-phosphopantetheinyl transferase EntD